MKSSVLNKLRRRKRRILRRIENHPGPELERPMIAASNIHYELGDRGSLAVPWGQTSVPWGMTPRSRGLLLRHRFEVQVAATAQRALSAP